MTLERVQQDLQQQAKTISELVQNDIRRQDRETAAAKLEELKEKHLDERFDRLEEQVANIYRLGRWLLAAAGSTLVLAIVTFALKGGFFNG